MAPKIRNDFSEQEGRPLNPAYEIHHVTSVAAY